MLLYFLTVFHSLYSTQVVHLLQQHPYLAFCILFTSASTGLSVRPLRHSLPHTAGVLPPISRTVSPSQSSASTILPFISHTSLRHLYSRTNDLSLSAPCHSAVQSHSISQPHASPQFAALRRRLVFNGLCDFARLEIVFRNPG